MSQRYELLYIIPATLTDNDNAATLATLEGCTTSGTARSCVYRITPPSGRSVVATVTCGG